MGELWRRAKLEQLAEEEDKLDRPIPKRRSHNELRLAVGIERVTYKFSPEYKGLYVRRERTGVVLRTNLPLWRLSEGAMRELRERIREIVDGRTTAVGFQYPSQPRNPKAR